MKRILALAILGLLTACGGADQQNDLTANKSTTLSIDTSGNLPKCDDAREALVAYVKTEKKLYACLSGNWEVVAQPTATETAKPTTTAQSTVQSAIQSVVVVTATPTPDPFSLQDARGQIIARKVPCTNNYRAALAMNLIYAPKKYVETAGCIGYVDFISENKMVFYENHFNRLQPEIEYKDAWFLRDDSKLPQSAQSQFIKVNLEDVFGPQANY